MPGLLSTHLVKVWHGQGQRRERLSLAGLHVHDAGLEAGEAFVLQAVALVVGVASLCVWIVVRSHGVPGGDVAQGLDPIVLCLLQNFIVIRICFNDLAIHVCYCYASGEDSHKCCKLWYL